MVDMAVAEVVVDGMVVVEAMVAITEEVIW